MVIGGENIGELYFAIVVLLFVLHDCLWMVIERLVDHLVKSFKYVILINIIIFTFTLSAMTLKHLLILEYFVFLVFFIFIILFVSVQT